MMKNCPFGDEKTLLLQSRWEECGIPKSGGGRNEESVTRMASHLCDLLVTRAMDEEQKRHGAAMMLLKARGWWLVSNVFPFKIWILPVSLISSVKFFFSPLPPIPPHLSSSSFSILTSRRLRSSRVPQNIHEDPNQSRYVHVMTTKVDHGAENSGYESRSLANIRC